MLGTTQRPATDIPFPADDFGLGFDVIGSVLSLAAASSCTSRAPTPCSTSCSAPARSPCRPGGSRPSRARRATTSATSST
ncbi:MAG: hypothetical protein R3F59_14890 [Myxococcota bacterium]